MNNPIYAISVMDSPTIGLTKTQFGFIIENEKFKNDKCPLWLSVIEEDFINDPDKFDYDEMRSGSALSLEQAEIIRKKSYIVGHIIDEKLYLKEEAENVNKNA